MDWWRQQVTKTNIAVAQAVDALKNQVRELLSKKKPITLDAHAKTNKQKNPDLNITGVYLSAWEKQNQVYPTGTHRWFKEKMAVFLFKNLNYCTIPFGIWSDYWHFTTKQNSWSCQLLSVILCKKERNLHPQNTLKIYGRN